MLFMNCIDFEIYFDGAVYLHEKLEKYFVWKLFTRKSLHLEM